jgi:hypothetical protein
MEGGCSTHGGDHKCVHNFRGEARIEKTRRLECLGVNGDNIKMHFERTGCEGVNWIYLAQDRYQYPDLVSMVLQFRTA